VAGRQCNHEALAQEVAALEVRRQVPRARRVLEAEREVQLAGEHALRQVVAALVDDGDFVSTWQALEELHRDGRARSIGVSNFTVEHLERLLAETDVVPAVNQIELHPYLLNAGLRAFGEEHGIATEAWSPIAKGAVLDDPAITAIARRLDRSPAQVALRWHLERGSIVFPKSTTPTRIAENFALFDFRLTPDDIDAIAALDRGEAGRTGPNPDAFAHVPA